MTFSFAPRVRVVAAIAMACVCGWMVMELELLGARILAPSFGSAQYVVMGSVIGVFLLSLSVGYLLGGWVSEHRRGLSILGTGLMAAGAWMAAMPWLIQPVCDGLFNRGFDDKGGSLLAALGLFGLPTVVMGTVSPIVVHHLTRTATASGRSAGLVLCFSTVASFAGCITTAFYLVEFSWNSTLRWSGLVLGIVGAAALAVGLMRPAGKTEESQ